MKSQWERNLLWVMQIKANEIADKKRIGTLKGRGVFRLSTIGGLHLVVASSSSGDVEVLGAGSHPGIARHLARKRESDIRFDDLSKSEDLDPRFFEDLLPRFSELTERFRKVNGDE